MNDTPLEPTSTPIDQTTNSQDDTTSSPVDLNSGNKSKRSRLFVFLMVCIAVVLLAGAAWFIHHRTSAKNANRTASISVANEKIPQVSCTTAQSLIKKQSVDGDQCYAAKFNVGTEPIQYIVIKQSAAYQQKQASQCQLDCGGNIPITRSDYIVRANGNVQFTLPDWTQPAEPDIDELTGCGDGNFGILNGQSGTASFVQDNGDIGLYVTAQTVKFPDQFGDNCTIAFKLTQNITNNQSATAGLRITQLKVHYNLKPTSSCQQQTGSKIYQCYQDQAIMRNDLSMCSMTVDPTDPNDGDTSCITDIALRRQDPTVCTMIQASSSSTVSQSVHNADVENCQTESGQLRDVFSHKLTVV